MVFLVVVLWWFLRWWRFGGDFGGGFGREVAGGQFARAYMKRFRLGLYWRDDMRVIHNWPRLTCTLACCR